MQLETDEFARISTNCRLECSFYKVKTKILKTWTDNQNQVVSKRTRLRDKIHLSISSSSSSKRVTLIGCTGWGLCTHNLKSIIMQEMGVTVKYVKARIGDSRKFHYSTLHFRSGKISLSCSMSISSQCCCVDVKLEKQLSQGIKGPSLDE